MSSTDPVEENKDFQPSPLYNNSLGGGPRDMLSDASNLTKLPITLPSFFALSYDERKDESKIQPKIGGMIEFLAQQGYGVVAMHEGFRFVKVRGQFAEEVEGDNPVTTMQRKVMEAIWKLPEKHSFWAIFTWANERGYKTVLTSRSELVNLITSVADRWFKPRVLQSLPSVEITVMRDKKDKCLFLFPEGVVEVTSDTIRRRDYDSQEYEGKTFWKSHILSHKGLDLEASHKGEMWQFFRKASGDTEPGHSRKTPKWRPNGKRMAAMMNQLGYLCSTHKQKSEAKAPWFCDYGDTGQDEGGSGKSLILGSLGYVREMEIVDGQEASKAYVWSGVKASTQLILVDDVARGWDVNSMYAKITGDLQVRDIYKPWIRFSFADAPKFCFSANWVPGLASSIRRRFPLQCFGHYYSSKFCPKQDFGHDFFDDWDKAEWDKFYALIFRCVAMFLKQGSVNEHCDQDLRRRQLVETTCEEFVDWIDHNIGYYLKQGKLARRDLYKSFLNDEPEFLADERAREFKPSRILGWMRRYVDYRGIACDPGTNKNKPNAPGESSVKNSEGKSDKGFKWADCPRNRTIANEIEKAPANSHQISVPKMKIVDELLEAEVRKRLAEQATDIVDFEEENRLLAEQLEIFAKANPLPEAPKFESNEDRWAGW